MSVNLGLPEDPPDWSAPADDVTAVGAALEAAAAFANEFARIVAGAVEELARAVQPFTVAVARRGIVERCGIAESDLRSVFVDAESLVASARLWNGRLVELSLLELRGSS